MPRARRGRTAERSGAGRGGAGRVRPRGPSGAEAAAVCGRSVPASRLVPLAAAAAPEGSNPRPRGCAARTVGARRAVTRLRGSGGRLCVSEKKSEHGAAHSGACVWPRVAVGGRSVLPARARNGARGIFPAFGFLPFSSFPGRASWTCGTPGWHRTGTYRHAFGSVQRFSPCEAQRTETTCHSTLTRG